MLSIVQVKSAMGSAIFVRDGDVGERILSFSGVKHFSCPSLRCAELVSKMSSLWFSVMELVSFSSSLVVRIGMLGGLRTS